MRALILEGGAQSREYTLKAVRKAPVADTQNIDPRVLSWGDERVIMITRITELTRPQLSLQSAKTQFSYMACS